MVTWNGSRFQYHDKAYIWNGNAFELVWEKLDDITGVFIEFMPYPSSVTTMITKKLGAGYSRDKNYIYFLDGIAQHGEYLEVNKIYRVSMEDAESYTYSKGMTDWREVDPWYTLTDFLDGNRLNWSNPIDYGTMIASYNTGLTNSFIISRYDVDGKTELFHRQQASIMEGSSGPAFFAANIYNYGYYGGGSSIVAVTSNNLCIITGTGASVKHYDTLGGQEYWDEIGRLSLTDTLFAKRNTDDLVVATVDIYGDFSIKQTLSVPFNRNTGYAFNKYGKVIGCVTSDNKLKLVKITGSYSASSTVIDTTAGNVFAVSESGRFILYTESSGLPSSQNAAYIYDTERNKKYKTYFKSKTNVVYQFPTSLTAPTYFIGDKLFSMGGYLYKLT